MFIKHVKWPALIALAIFLSACYNASSRLVKFDGRTMGTTYHISYLASGTDNGLSSSDHHKNIEQLLITVNDQMSTYQADSELSRFNKSTSTEPFEVSSDTAFVVQEAIRLSYLTDKRLDVTVGPLVNLWGFGPLMRPDKVPTLDVISKVRQRIGIDHLSSDGNTLTKDIAELYVDLSTVAKGFAVDKIANYLEKYDINDYLVEVGGEIRANGKANAQRDWIIAIEKPLSTHRAIQQYISPLDNGLATSGDYRIYYEENGQRFSHIIDPATGRPIAHKLVSVTVIHPSSMVADGLSTAIMVMGAEDGLQFAQDQSLAVFMIVKTDNGFKEVYTDAFKPFMVDRPQH